jgi:hypothetical protein
MTTNQTAMLGTHIVNRIGFGAMQLAGPGVVGPPRDADAARAVLHRAVELGVDHIDTAQFYGPDVVNELIREALEPYPSGLRIVSKVGGKRDEAGAWLAAQAGSIKVKEGDRVQRGDLPGLVGNSGNTSAPHLHFHVMDGPSALTSEGVPYVIDRFATRGRLRSTAVFDRYENTTTPFDVVPFAGSADNRAEMPLDLTVASFR